MPNLVAYDLAGVQPMNGPTGLIFAMRSRYTSQSGTEAFFDEPDTGFSAQREGNDADQGPYTTGSDADSVGFGTAGTQIGTNPGALNPQSNANQGAYTVGQGMTTANAEGLGESGNAFNEMAFSIEKVTVTAMSRALEMSIHWNWHKTSRLFMV